MAFLNKVKAQAEDKGVTICMEYLNSKVNHKDYMFDHIAWGVDVMKRVNSPRVKILFDIYHAQIMDGDIVRNIRDNFQWIGHFHTGGNPGRHDIDETQELNYHFIAQAIADLNFTGFMSHEYSPAPGHDPIADAQQGASRFAMCRAAPCCGARRCFRGSSRAGRANRRQMLDPARRIAASGCISQFCINCHGSQAQGTEDGPDLIRSRRGLA